MTKAKRLLGIGKQADPNQKARKASVISHLWAI